MMGSGRDLRGGREAMTERLAGLPPELQAYVQGLRDTRDNPSGWHHSIGGRFSLAGYTSGGAELSERTGALTYSLGGPGIDLSVSGGPLSFRSGDTLSISGWAPVDLRVDLGIGAADSLRIGFRSATTPSSLDQSQVSALASVGTSAVDLASIQFGTPLSLTVRYAHTRSLLSSLLLSLELGGAFEPRPGGGESTYWRGATARIGMSVRDAGGPTRVGAGVVVTRSSADSLDGRNLFSGGGTVLVRAHAARLVGSAQDALVGASLSYFVPYSTTDADASGRRLPQGNFAGASAVAVWPVGGVILTPAAILSRESSETVTGTGRVNGVGWSVSTSLSTGIDLSRSFRLTPEVGYTGGSIRLDVLTAIGTGPTGDPIYQSSGVTDALSGWWMAVRWSASF